MIKKFSTKTWRTITQTFLGLFLTNGYFQVIYTRVIYSGPLKSVCVPFLNCHACPTALFGCPIGMLQHFMALGQVPWFLIGFFIITGLIIGRAACGWLCPFGLIQDVMYKIKSKKFFIPKPLNYLKYPVLLVLVLLLPYITYEHWFSKLCPYGALIAGIPWAAWNPIDAEFGEHVIPEDGIGIWFIIKMAILAFFLIWFVFSKRPFCRVICPMGAIWALFNRISLLHFKVKESCLECHTCARLCPMDLDVNKDVDSENCIKCLDCTACKHVEAKFGLTDIEPADSAPDPVLLSEEHKI